MIDDLDPQEVELRAKRVLHWLQGRKVARALRQLDRVGQKLAQKQLRGESYYYAPQKYPELAKHGFPLEYIRDDAFSPN